MIIEKANCWEFRKCGREPGGVHIQDLGICPATTADKLNGMNGGMNAGRACWLIAGTMCGQVIKGTYAKKLHNCIKCDFYRGVDKISLLIVEDEAIIALDMAARLERLGYTVIAIVSTGEKAVSEAAASRPDLILMDILLPGNIDGIEAAEEIRSMYDIPIIFVTAFSNEDIMVRMNRTKHYGYLIKPVEEFELSPLIENGYFRFRLEKDLN